MLQCGSRVSLIGRFHDYKDILKYLSLHDSLKLKGQNITPRSIGYHDMQVGWAIALPIFQLMIGLYIIKLRVYTNCTTYRTHGIHKQNPTNTGICDHCLAVVCQTAQSRPGVTVWYGDTRRHIKTNPWGETTREKGISFNLWRGTNLVSGPITICTV